MERLPKEGSSTPLTLINHVHEERLHAEILYKIKRGGAAPIRPELTRDGDGMDQALNSLVTDCWNEKPSERPSSERICSQLRGMVNASNKTNLMDHLFAMLEQHTEELEREVCRYDVVKNQHKFRIPINPGNHDNQEILPLYSLQWAPTLVL
ncbi:hypothetical protein ANCDUO_02354 [Ancylostoma duodenale]|uniref:Serine-threonine/tyrosine-protein kinase catalytic domain-containing protein n=1 Tax=Ancylostoma duodenale TaxID=51022 RepID=A0A0C2HCN1_9BILA|nr:hypothetical protein ANCDUO_02354 [Ancylostoma duodenale]